MAAVIPVWSGVIKGVSAGFSMGVDIQHHAESLATGAKTE